MELSNLVSSIREGATSNASVKAVYGEPITAQGKTIIPVARIGYGFGGGGGGRGGDGTDKQAESGGGGGGGGMAMPMGVVEVTASETRFVPFIPGKKLAAAAGAGFVLGIILGRRRRG